MSYYNRSFLLKALDRIGIGAAESSQFTLKKTTIKKVNRLINEFADFDDWEKQRSESVKNHLYQGWAAGGFSVSDYQLITIILDQKKNDVNVKIKSRSRGGQIIDWGANEYNIKRLKSYLENPDIKLKKRIIPGEKEGLILLIIFSILGLATVILIAELLNPEYSANF
jgi:hypothetical protein